MPLTLFASNRLENLEILLFEQLGQSGGGNIFEPRVVIVPGAAIRQRLIHGIAKRCGICANIDFPFLAKWIWNRMQRVDERVAEQSPLDEETLVWRLLDVLCQMPAEDSRLGAYLARADERMRYELAAQLAGLFGRYATYRPHWLTAWQKSRQPDDLPCDPVSQADSRWQAGLWRSLASGLTLAEAHPVDSFLKVMANDAAQRQRLLPRQLSIFALPAIPPLYLRAIEGLSEWMDIDLYVLNPCQEYWFDAARRRAPLGPDGNALLAAWGQSGRSALELLFEQTSGKAAEAGLFFDPAAATGDKASALARIQQSILRLEEPGGKGIRPDASLAIHACHGDHRQIQVLHDQLLDLFAHDSTLTAADVLILAPRLEDMAPTIEAVFGTLPETDPRRIPYRIAGLPVTRTNDVARALQQLLDLPDSRFEASRLMTLLEAPLIARRFDFDAGALELIRGWFDVAGIRWGRDAADRERHGAPAGDRHTFRQGLARLMLGYALPGGETLVAGLLPAGDIEGDRADILGRLALAIERLAEWAALLSQPRSPAEWQTLLHHLLDEFIGAEATPAEDLQAARRHIDQLALAWQTANFQAPLPLPVVRLALQENAGGEALARPSGELTFAPLAAMRNFPCRIVCLLGMNDDFPADQRAPEFDLIARKPQKFDRQRQQDDRALFLDALLAARERLLIFYNGRSPRDNQEVPPSVLVEQLLDTLGWQSAEIVVAHPLQPFSRRYFDPRANDDRLFSYAREYAEALKHAVGETAGKLPLPMGEDDGDSDDEDIPEAQPRFHRPGGTTGMAAAGNAECSLEDLRRSLGNTSRFWLQGGLRIALPATGEDLEDVEPLEAGHAVIRGLQEQLFALCRQPGEPGFDAGVALAHARAGNHLPDGELGLGVFEDAWASAAGLARRVRAATAAPLLPPVRYELDFAGADGSTLRLAGALSRLHPTGLVSHRVTRLGARDELALWIEHLVLCCVRPAGIARQSLHLALDGDLILGDMPAGEAADRLRTLLALRAAAAAGPLPFFVKSACAFAASCHEQRQKQPDVDVATMEAKAMRAARKEWLNPREESWGEGRNPWHRIAFRGIADPLVEPVMRKERAFLFGELARDVFAPLFDSPRQKIDRKDAA